MCISPLCNGSEAKAARDESSGGLGFSGAPSPAVSRESEPDGVEAHGVPVEEESCDQDGVVVFETSLVPVVEVEMAQLPPSFDPRSRALDETPEEEEGPHPEVAECSGIIVGASPASYFRSDGPQVIRCFQVAPRPLWVTPPLSSAWPLYGFKAATTCSLLCSTTAYQSV